MFGQSMDSARDAAGGVAGTVLIPMRFVWPYGGRSVFLSGSFTRCLILLIVSEWTFSILLGFFSTLSKDLPDFDLHI